MLRLHTANQHKITQLMIQAVKTSSVIVLA